MNGILKETLPVWIIQLKTYNLGQSTYLEFEDLIHSVVENGVRLWQILQHQVMLVKVIGWFRVLFGKNMRHPSLLIAWIYTHVAQDLLKNMLCL